MNHGADGCGSGGAGAESGAFPEAGAVLVIPATLALMLREFSNASPADLRRLAEVWGLVPGGAAARSLGVPATKETTGTD